MPHNPQQPSWADTFAVSVADDQLTVRRTDTKTGTGMLERGLIARLPTMLTGSKGWGQVRRCLCLVFPLFT